MDETEIPILNYEDLITDKSANARPKDLDDIKNLKDIQRKAD